MPRSANSAFRIGDWLVEPDLDRMCSAERNEVMEPKTMAVLVHLARRPGHVCSADQIIDEVWGGRPMGDNPVHKCVSKLRSALGDNAKHPKYIETVPKKGYRVIAAVEWLGDEVEPAEAPRAAPPPASASRPGWLPAAAAVLIASAVLAGIGVSGVYRGTLQDNPTADAALPNSIAILPFDNLGDDAAESYFSDGVTEDIRARLAQVDGLDVASRTSSRMFMEGSGDVGQIAAKLNVAMILEGTVRKEHEQVRITAQLIDARSNHHLGSWIYTRELTSIFRIQEEIAREVVNRVLDSVPDFEPRRETDSIRAYDAYLRAKAELGQAPEEIDFDKAIALFEEALAADSTYARAHAGICQAYQRRYQYTRTTGYIALAEEACNSAAALDDQLSDVPMARGRLFGSLGRHEEAAAQFRKAISLQPTDVSGYTGLATVLSEAGDAVAAREQYQAALSLQPRDWQAHSDYALFLLRNNEFGEAARHYQLALDLGPANATSFSNLGVAYYLLGDFELAARAFQRSLEMVPNRSGFSNLGTAQYYLGRLEDAAESYRAAIDLAPQDHRVWGNLSDALAHIPTRSDEYQEVLKQAVSLAREELRLNANDAVLHARLGSWLAGLGQSNESRKHLASAVALDPGKLYVHYHSAVARVRLGDDDLAIESLRKLRTAGYDERLIERDPAFSPLRSRSDYQQILAAAPPG